MDEKYSESNKATVYAGIALVVIGCLLFGAFMLIFVLDTLNIPFIELNMTVLNVCIFGGVFFVISGLVLKNIDKIKQRQEETRLEHEAEEEEIMEHEEEGAINLFSVHNEKTIMVKCRACGKLNDENAKFCCECGDKL